MRRRENGGEMIDKRMKRGKKRERQRVEKVMRGERERIPDLSGGR